MIPEGLQTAPAWDIVYYSFNIGSEDDQEAFLLHFSNVERSERCRVIESSLITPVLR